MNSMKKSKVLAEFSVFPIGQKGTSVGKYVAAAIAAINQVKGLKYEVTAMGTVLEADNIETIFEAVKAAHEALIDEGVQRVESTLRIDDRRDKSRTMKDKVDVVKRYVKQLD
jgi:uncharacterized protein (TIGR00106 family)